MKGIDFEQAVVRIYEKDSSYDPAAYFYLKEALDHALKSIKPGRDGGHVTAVQLLESFRDHALEQFGPMANTLFSEWGLKKTDDVGRMVFALIEEGMFGKQDSDKLEDFFDVYTYHDAFVAPFLPKQTLTSV